MALTRQEIARAGLRLLNEVGLNGLTLRLIADELGVKAPALYWHMKNKDELLDEMATQMWRDAPPRTLTIADAGDRETWLAEHARSLRQMLLSYRDGAKVFSGTYFTDPKAPIDDPLQQLIEAGFDAKRAARALLTLYTFTIGFTIEEQAVYPKPGQRDARYEGLPLTGVLFDDVDAQFEAGLAIVLAGIRAWLSPGR